MRITELLKSESIALGATPANKKNAIEMLTDLMAASGNLSDKEVYKQDVFAREASGTTGLGINGAVRTDDDLPTAFYDVWSKDQPSAADA